MKCRCGSMECPIAEWNLRAMEEAASRASKSEARQRPWEIHWVRGEGAYLFHCRQGVDVDVLNGGPARCATCGKEDSLEEAHASAVPLREVVSRARFPHLPGPSKTDPDALQGMRDLLARMKQVVGEIDRLLEKSK